MNFQPFVYGLVDPADAGHIRYVGMAFAHASRPYDHARRARSSDKKSHLLNWVRKLQAEGRDYQVITLEQMTEHTSISLLGFVEKCYIKSLREIGHNLTNVALGGEGGGQLGYTHTDAARIKMSEASKGRKKSAEHKANISSARKAAWASGVYSTDEYRQKLREARLGQPSTHNPETAAKISKALIGRVMSDEWRAKNSAAQTGRKQSAETRAKRSDSLRLAWARRKAIQNTE